MYLLRRSMPLMVLIMVISITAFGQFGQPSSQKKEDFKMQKRFFVGGGLGFGISSYSTHLMVAPVVGYRLTPDIDIGVRLNYTYNRYDDTYYGGVKFSTNNFGAGIFATYYLFFFSDLFIHAEYEALNYDKPKGFKLNSNELEMERAWVSSLFLGGGYRQWISGNAFVSMTVLFNLLDSYDSPYSNPIFRIGVGVGL